MDLERLRRPQKIQTPKNLAVSAAVDVYDVELDIVPAQEFFRRGLRRLFGGFAMKMARMCLSCPEACKSSVRRTANFSLSVMSP